MRWNRFFYGVLFAAFIALAYLPLGVLLAPWLGRSLVWEAYGLGTVAFYLFAIAPSLRSGVASAIAALVAGGLIGILVPFSGASLVTSAWLIGLCRSGFLYRSPSMDWGRSLFLEVIVFFGSLALASVLGGSGIFSGSLMLWSFYLVQSSFFLVGRPESPLRIEKNIDAFEKARVRLEALLDEA